MVTRLTGTIVGLLCLVTTAFSQELKKSPEKPSNCGSIVDITKALGSLGLAPLLVTTKPESGVVIYVDRELSVMAMMITTGKGDVGCVTYISKDVNINKKALEMLADDQIGKRA